ncbi:MAG TPA: type IV pilus twitching motility protein PilT [Thermodesulfobacteriota bacterium]|nr:type IV pilus twitching motility protein PilT [Thermodesulfobacteriota bacterium]
MNIDELLKWALKQGASDIHLKTGSNPVLRVNGKLTFVKEAPRLSNEDIKKMAFSMMNQWQREKFEKSYEMDLAYGISGVSRFRVNVFQQRGTLSMAIRAIPYDIMSFHSLNLPPVLEKIAQEERGLVIVTGTTGSGKSTTLASLIDYINSTRARHIITIEDPIEYTHQDKKSYINQREVGIDTLSFANALRAALREDPDVILVGEMRDLESIEMALAAAETGHLVLTTLHTLDAQETINRILAVFPSHQQNQIRYQLSQVLKAIISQRLMPKADGKGRVPAVEVLIATARVKDLIADPLKTKEIRTAIEEGHLHYGMQTFDQCLYNLYKSGLITYDEAMRQATNKDDLALRIKGITSGSASLAREQIEVEKPRYEGSLKVEKI